MREKEPLAEHTTLKVGGDAQYFVEVHSEDELVEAIAFAKEKEIPVKVLGGGSNVLVSDKGVSGLVIKNCLKGTSSKREGERILLTVGAGESLDGIVAETVAKNWWGLENLSHIPGTVGATPVQNVGAYGVEVKDLITTVRVYDRDEETFKELSNEQCSFAYRNSLFKREEGKNLIVTAVTFSLSVNPEPNLTYKDLQTYFAGKNPSQKDIREAIITIRSKKFPDWHRVGTAGSFFKNPIVSRYQFTSLKKEFPAMPGFLVDEEHVKIPLGWVLDKILNLKGVSCGPVGTYEGQALVLINSGGATAKEIHAFASTVADRVKEEVGIEVEWEVTRW